MASPTRRGVILPRAPSARTFAAWLFFGSCSTTVAGDPAPPGPVPSGIPVIGGGTLGYGGPGLYPGYYGFGLSYHRGYGYGGGALGVGANGGYPFYGGPGYPRDAPRLVRFGPITPFPYFGGPGYPSAGHPNYFACVGPLAVDQPVAYENNGSNHDYGPLTGAIPYPETLFAPYASPDPSKGSSIERDFSDPADVEMRPVRPSSFVAPASARVGTSNGVAPEWGFDEEPMRDADGSQGMKVTRVYPGTPAERGGLRTGDVVRSINGYLTRRPGNLAWIIAEAAPDRVLTMSVSRAGYAEAHVIVIRLR